MDKTREKHTENETSHTHLHEVDAASEAIRNGEGEAIMVSGSQSEQLYANSAADTPYRTFIKEMGEGAVTLSKGGTILFCNSTFAKVVGAPEEEVIGSEINRFIAPAEVEKLDSFLAQLKHNQQDVIIVMLVNGLTIRFSVCFLPSHLQGDHYIIIATDISDLKQKEQELVKDIGKLVKHVKALRDLRIENISETIDKTGKKNKLRAANTKLGEEIIKLNRLVEKLKQKKPNT
jgi:PAS domain S-box-containing protein